MNLDDKATFIKGHVGLIEVSQEIVRDRARPEVLEKHLHGRFVRKHALLVLEAEMRRMKLDNQRRRSTCKLSQYISIGNDCHFCQLLSAAVTRLSHRGKTRESDIPYGGGCVPLAAKSPESDAERMPAPFLGFLFSAAWDDASRRARLTGRTVEAVMVRSLAELGVCFALGGGFLADKEGDGDDVDAAMPLVWIPAGTGRFALVAPFCWTTGLAGGAIVATPTAAAAAASFPPLVPLSRGVRVVMYPRKRPSIPWRGSLWVLLRWGQVMMPDVESSHRASGLRERGGGGAPWVLRTSRSGWPAEGEPEQEAKMETAESRSPLENAKVLRILKMKRCSRRQCRVAPVRSAVTDVVLLIADAHAYKARRSRDRYLILKRHDSPSRRHAQNEQIANSPKIRANCRMQALQGKHCLQTGDGRSKGWFFELFMSQRPSPRARGLRISSGCDLNRTAVAMRTNSSYHISAAIDTCIRNIARGSPSLFSAKRARASIIPALGPDEPNRRAHAFHPPPRRRVRARLFRASATTSQPWCSSPLQIHCLQDRQTRSQLPQPGLCRAAARSGCW